MLEGARMLYEAAHLSVDLYLLFVHSFESCVIWMGMVYKKPSQWEQLKHGNCEWRTVTSMRTSRMINEE